MNYFWGKFKVRVLVIFLIGLLTFVLFQNTAPFQFQSVELTADVSNLGPTMNIEFRGNESNVKAFYDPADSDVAALPERYFQNHYPAFQNVRLGNTFFGYECIDDANLEENISVAKKDANNRIVYNFEQPIQYYREMLRAGVYPLVTLTGFPKDLYRLGTHIYTRKDYGCTTVPPIDFNTDSAVARMPEFTKLLREYFRALKADPVLAPTLNNWNFATWAEPFSKDTNGHMAIDDQTKERYASYKGVSVDSVNVHDLRVEVVATVLAVTIAVAKEFEVSIHIGNFAGEPNELQDVIERMYGFTYGRSVINYAKGISFSKYSLVQPNTGRVSTLINSIRQYDPDIVPFKEAYLNEFGLIGFEGNQKAWEAEPSLWSGIFYARALENVFSSYDPNQRSITKFNFWHDSLFFLPLNADRMQRFDDYLKKPSYHAMNFYSQLIGLNRLVTTSSEADKIGIVGGRFENSLTSRFVIFNESSYDDTFLDASAQASKTRTARLVVRGMQSQKPFSITIHKVDQNYGNPLKSMLGGNFDYRYSPDLAYDDVRKRIEPTGVLLERTNSPDFFKNARKTDDPTVRSFQSVSTVGGTIEVALDLAPNEMAYVEIVKVLASEDVCSQVNSMSLNFNNTLNGKNFAPLTAKFVSLDDGYNAVSPALQSEKSHGLRFFTNSFLTYPCSFLKPDTGSASLRFKISSDEADPTSRQILLSSLSTDLRNGHQLELVNGNLVASMIINGVIHSASYTLRPEDFDKWNLVEVAWLNSKLRLLFNNELKADKVLASIQSGALWNYKLEVGQINRQFQFQGLIDSIVLGEFTGNFEGEISASMPTQAGYDIIVVAGQSNAVGIGLPPAVEAPELSLLNENTALPCQRICQLGRKDVNQHTLLHDLKVLPATDPLDHVNTGRTGFAMTFAKRLSLLLPTNRKVLIVPVAIGGSSILQWDLRANDFVGDSTLLYDDMLIRVNAALTMEGKKNRIVAFLWQQAEADIKISSLPGNTKHSLMSNETYYLAKLNELHTNLRRDLPATNCFPILMGLPSQDWVNTNRIKFETTIKQVADLRPCTEAVSSDGLVSNSVVGDNDDTIHFSGQSQITLGERYFKVFLQNFW